MNMISLIAVPLIIAFVALYGVIKKIDVYAAMITGAKDGLKILINILPPLVALLTGVYMLRASGALDLVTNFLTPVLHILGIPPECTPLALLRPFSGGAALATGSEIIKTYGVNSLAGRTAAVMLGSSETTFYVISVYFGAVGVKRTRYAIPAALISDLVGIVASSIVVKLMFSGK